jgi:hypothetical protein
MDPNDKPSFLRRALKRVTQPRSWVGVKLCEVIVFVVDAFEAVAEKLKETAKAVVEVAVEIGKRVSENEFVQDIREGAKAVKKLTDDPETLHTDWLILLWLWSMAMGLACSSYVAAPWAAASTAFCGIGAIYFAMFTTTIIFAQFLICRLARPSRN